MPKEEAMPYVYIRDKEHAWIPGRVLKKDAKTATVVVQKYENEQEMLLNASSTTGTKVKQETVQLKDYDNGVLPMQNVDDRGKLADLEDMVNLPYLHEAAILYNIKTRHVKAKPYTRTGDMVIAVNPYQWLTDLYTEKNRKYYAQKIVWEISESDPRAFMPPHVYETSALSYKGMAFDGMNQSILVSGESGAGKTETVKICMNHIASVQEGPGGSHSESSVIVQRVLDSNPLLEAFGNAKTRRNDNSSRFGKYTQLQFDHAGEIGRPVAKLAGSKCDVYLLEKNRVVKHDSEERTYHIFYQILAAPDSVKAGIWDYLKGKNNESFKYVGATTTNSIEGVSDGEQFQKTLHVLKEINLGEDDIKNFLRAICIVLQLGNMAFAGDSDKSSVTSTGELTALAKLMDIPEKELGLSLTERTMKTKDESYKVPLGTDAASDSADALAKEIYGKVFLWLVRAINRATCAEENFPGATPGKKFGIVGLLDIFGFESFGINRFEQLCINYANEKLQQKFTQDIFKAVLAEYEFEGIPLSDIKYDDNTDVLDLIEGRTGLCALLNEECVRPKGSGEGFVNKALAGNKKSPCLVPNKTDPLSFAIMHYAGGVMYQASNFVDANKDTLPTDLEDAATKCSNPIISGAFNYEKYQAAESAKKGGTPRRMKSNIMAPTVWTKYKAQLSHLMTNLHSTQSRYIRCIKPNTIKKPLIMEHSTTVEQLRCAGIVAGVTISRSAFPNKLYNSQVYARYNGMWDKAKFPSAKSGGMKMEDQVRADCDAVMTCALKSHETTENGKTIKAFVVGKTRTYFRAGALEYLESQRITGLDAQAIAIQKAARGYLVRKFMGNTSKVKKEEEEAALRAQQEREEQLKREREELDAALKKEMEDNKKGLAALERELQREDERAASALQDAEEQLASLEKEKADLDRMGKEAMEPAVLHKQEMDRLAAKLAINTSVIETLRKENKKIHKEHDKIEKQYNMFKENNDKLLKTSTKAESDFESLNGELEYSVTVNDRLTETRESTTKENGRLKDTVQNEQLKYMAFAESRLEIQKTLAFILNTIKENCSDASLVNRCFETAHAAEAEGKAVMSALEASQDM